MSPWRIRDRATFESLRRSRRRAQEGSIRVSYVPGPEDVPVRVAYVVPKRAGSAVTRNRIRRRLRPLAAELPLAPGAYLIGADAPAADQPTEALRRDLARAAARAAGRSDDPAPARR